MMTELEGRAFPDASRTVDLCALEEIPPGTMRSFDPAGDGQLVLVANLDGRLRATAGVCTHRYADLGQGFLMGDTVMCALHQARFSLLDGEVLDPPAEEPLAVYPVRAEAGRVLVELPQG
jgi:3-phenylpropionate/trans-cinnamate dioxygenase ferredoxin subunit